jgi:exopolysaccharide biosynthesis polyprenyl glycosylphosphotransferase
MTTSAGTDHAAFLDGLELHDELSLTIDPKTLEILDRRRRTSVVKRRGWLIRRMLLAADLIGLLAAMAVAELLTPTGADEPLSQGAEFAIFALSLPLWVVAAKVYGLYERDEERTDHSGVDEFTGVFHMITVCTWLFWAVTYVFNIGQSTLPKLLVFWAAAVVFVVTGRAIARAICRRRINYLQNTIIVGAGEVGQLIAKKVLHHPEYGINLVGFVDAEPRELSGATGHIAILGGPERLPTLIRLFDVERVIIAFSLATHEDMLDLIRSLKDFDLHVDIVPRYFELVGSEVGIHAVEGISLVGLPPMRLSKSSRLLKLVLDVALAGAALVLLLPMFVVIAIWIKLDSRGPVFFRQVRMGSGGRTFRIYKFRTMHADAELRKFDIQHMNQHLLAGEDARMFKVADDPRVTTVGRVLRRYSLDELPQLFNVLRTQMSLVGPRPLILDENEHVVSWGRTRLRLKPGITGLWQVLGRSEIPFEEMTRLDYLYVTSWSLWGDIMLICRTLPALVRTRNAY